MDFAGLILAGGEGSRWGGPKAWATLPDGTSFLESCFEVLHAAGARPIVATLPPGSVHPVPGGLTTALLPSRELDMFASLRMGLSRLLDSRDWYAVAVLPVDHPLVKSSTVVALTTTRARAAVPSYRGKHGHPVCLGRLVIESIVNGSSIGPTLRNVLQSIDAADVPVDDPGVVANCNTPQALKRALDRV